MSNKLVSILVPVYNGRKYLQDFLDSILSQTYRPLQVLIADDCSTDDSFFICQQWKKRIDEERITVFCYKNEKNMGLSANISQLAAQAKGKFIFFADQDDVWEKNKIEKQVEYLNKHPKCIICLCDRSITDERLRIVRESNYRDMGYSISIMNFEEVIKHQSAYAANTMAIRNNNYNIFNIPTEVVQHDTFVAVMASRYGTIDFLYESLVLYRIHENNLSGNYRGQFSKNIFRCFLDYYKIAKRIKKRNEIDGKILEKELYERFHVKLRNYDNAFLHVVGISPLKYAWKRMIKEHKEGSIGAWIK